MTTAMKKPFILMDEDEAGFVIPDVEKVCFRVLGGGDLRASIFVYAISSGSQLCILKYKSVTVAHRALSNAFLGKRCLPKKRVKKKKSKKDSQ